MKRLTGKRHKENGHYLMCSVNCARDCGEDCDNLVNAIERLAAYEDTGLEPEEIEKAMDIVKSAVSAFEDFGVDRLAELAQADREGRCVVLPAKTVFELVWCAGEGCDMVCPVSIDGKGCCDFCDHGTIIVEEVPCRQEHIERIGVDVFLIRKEADAALRREQDG